MITEMLDAAINEALCTNYIIKEFQLGAHAMKILAQECRESMCYYGVEVDKVTRYKGITVAAHKIDFAVMFLLEPKI